MLPGGGGSTFYLRIEPGFELIGIWVQGGFSHLTAGGEKWWRRLHLKRISLKDCLISQKQLRNKTQRGVNSSFLWYSAFTHVEAGTGQTAHFWDTLMCLFEYEENTSGFDFTLNTLRWFGGLFHSLVYWLLFLLLLFMLGSTE